MDPITILIAVAGIVATGSLTKIGENITDETLSQSKLLLSEMRKSAPKTANALENVDRQRIDYGQAFQELNAASKTDKSLTELLEKMRLLVSSNLMLTELVEQELNQANPQLSTVIEDWKGINIKGGTNTIAGNTFNF